MLIRFLIRRYQPHHSIQLVSSIWTVSAPSASPAVSVLELSTAGIKDGARRACRRKSIGTDERELEGTAVSRELGEADGCQDGSEDGSRVGSLGKAGRLVERDTGNKPGISGWLNITRNHRLVRENEEIEAVNMKETNREVDEVDAINWFGVTLSEYNE